MAMNAGRALLVIAALGAARADIVWQSPANWTTALRAGIFNAINNQSISVTTDPYGNEAGAIRLAGNSGSYLSTAQQYNLPGGGSRRTMELWLKCTDSLEGAMLEYGGSPGAFQTATRSSMFTAGAGTGFVSQYQDLWFTQYMCIGVWRHLMFTYDGPSRLGIWYLNGIAQYIENPYATLITPNVSFVNIGWNGKLAHNNGEQLTRNGAATLAGLRIWNETLPSPWVDNYTVNAVFAADCASLDDCASQPLYATLTFVGRTLTSMRRTDDFNSPLRMWTTATVVNTTSTARDDVVVATYDIRDDLVAWLYWGGTFSFAVQNFVFEPLRMPVACNYTAPLQWGSVVRLTTFGLGVIGVQGVWAQAVTPNGDGRAYLPCMSLTVESNDTLSCTLRYVSNAWNGSVLQFWLSFDGAPIAVTDPPQELFPLINTTTTFVMPVATRVTAPALLRLDGGDTIAVTLPHPVWDSAELPTGTRTQAYRLFLVHWSGETFGGSCYPDANDVYVLACVSPIGFGDLVQATLDMGNTMLTISSVLASNDTDNATAVPWTLAYQPQPLQSMVPSYIPALPTPINVTLAYADNGGLVDVRAMNISNASCASLDIQLASRQIVCVGWIPLEAYLASHGTGDTIPLFVTMPWAGSTYYPTLPVPGTLLARPTLTTVSPISVMTGNTLVVVGNNFCPPTGCLAGNPLSMVHVLIGQATCTDVAVLSTSVATCTVPAPDVNDPHFPNYNVSITNGVGLAAQRLLPVSYPSTGYVAMEQALPTVFIPGDGAAPWALRDPIRVRIQEAATRAPLVGRIKCTLQMLSSGALLVPLTLPELDNVVGDNTIDFGRVSIQAPFNKPQVTLSVTCSPVNGTTTAIEALTWTVTTVQLRLRVCTPMVLSAQSQVDLPAWSLALYHMDDADDQAAACERPAWMGFPLPVIQCAAAVTETATSNLTDLVIQGGAAAMNLTTGRVTFDAMSVGGRAETEYGIITKCTIGSLPVLPSIESTIFVSGCPPGKTNEGAQCVPCAGGQYSRGGTDSCHTCPLAGVSCTGGVLALLPNFYRPDAGSHALLTAETELHKCTFAEGCAVDAVNYTHSCNPGYTGVLCGVCDTDNDYAQLGDRCSPCLASGSNSAIVAVGGIACIMAIGIFVLRRQTNDVQRPEHSTALRILLSFVQALGTLRTLKVTGTDLFRRATQWTEVLSPAVASQGPMQCITKPSFLVVFCATLAAPVLIMITAMLFLIGGSAVEAARSKMGTPWLSQFRSFLGVQWAARKHLSVLLFVAYLCYMPITTSCISVLKCTAPIAGVRYMVADLRIACGSPPHVAASILSGVTLVGFSLGFPLGLFIVLARASAKSLEDPNFIHVWSFLYSGYKSAAEQPPQAAVPDRKGLSCTRCILRDNRNLVFWESLILLRKAGIVLIATLATTAIGQAAAMVALMAFCFAAHWRLLPYTSPLFNVMEAVSMGAVILTALGGLLLLDGDDLSTNNYALIIVMVVMDSLVMVMMLTTLVRKFLKTQNLQQARSIFQRASSAKFVALKDGKGAKASPATTKFSDEVSGFTANPLRSTVATPTPVATTPVVAPVLSASARVVHLDDPTPTTVAVFSGVSAIQFVQPSAAVTAAKPAHADDDRRPSMPVSVQSRRANLPPQSTTEA